MLRRLPFTRHPSTRFMSVRHLVDFTKYDADRAVYLRSLLTKETDPGKYYDLGRLYKEEIRKKRCTNSCCATNDKCIECFKREDERIYNMCGSATMRNTAISVAVGFIVGSILYHLAT